MDDSQEYADAALRILRGLTGNRWTWPPMKVVDRYPVPSSRRLRLASKPVIEVLKVTDSKTGRNLSFVQAGAGKVLLQQDSSRYCGRGSEVDVEYIYGCEPPEDFQRAAAILAEEFRLADSGDSACRLPDRVTSITREGVTYSMLDPMELLTEGRTGIYEIDLLLRSTGRASARAMVFSSEYPAPLRLSTEEQSTNP